ncbi:MAG: GTP-binding protein [Proteobacteria bacterium]|nr:GTP-binding protein [Pseudomonadota bacterium]
MTIPYTVIGGFLGAGKTTLLNRWLRACDGVRMAVLVNDFGALNIDAALIESSAGDTVALTNGCVCCQIGDDLSMALLRVLDATPPYDAIVVEASGVSDPGRIAQFGRADPALVVDGVIVLVDAAAAEAHARDPLLADTLQRQLKAADLVVLNKCDLVDDAQRERLRAWIAHNNPRASIVETAEADVPLPLLSGLAMGRGPAGSCGCGRDHSHRDAQHDHAHPDADPAHGALFETWTCRPEGVFDAERLRARLKDPPAGLLRLKGTVRTGGATGWSLIQVAGRHARVLDAPAPGRDGAGVVAIALRGRLPADALAALFDGSSSAR